MTLFPGLLAAIPTYRQESLGRKGNVNQFQPLVIKDGLRLVFVLASRYLWWPLHGQVDAGPVIG